MTVAAVVPIRPFTELTRLAAVLQPMSALP